MGKRKKAASLSHSPLARPETPAQAMAVQFQNFLHLPDPSPIYVVLGTVAANMMEGPPAWTMLVGPSGCGKTALLTSVLGVHNIRDASSISSEGALLSGVRKKDRAAGSSGGLLNEIKPRGMLMFKDFTSILELGRDGGKIYAALRESYDGFWTRDVGTDGHRKLTWEGKLGVLSGVTNMIDRSHSLVSSMGERFVFYRYPRPTIDEEAEGWAESNKALSNGDRMDLAHNMQSLVAGFFDGLGLDWERNHSPREMTQVEKDRLIGLAQLGSHCRSVVPRDPQTKQIIDVSVSEFPTRICSELGALFNGMEFIGVPTEESWRIIEKIALDSMPLIRRVALDEVVKAGAKGVRTREVENVLRCHKMTVVRTLEDLTAQQVIRQEEKDLWTISEWARKVFAKMKGKLG